MAHKAITQHGRRRCDSVILFGLYILTESVGHGWIWWVWQSGDFMKCRVTVDSNTVRWYIIFSKSSAVRWAELLVCLEMSVGELVYMYQRSWTIGDDQELEYLVHVPGSRPSQARRNELV